MIHILIRIVILDGMIAIREELHLIIVNVGLR